MDDLILTTRPGVSEKFAAYPPAALAALSRLRELILDVARNDPKITRLEESLKWGEPSYRAGSGSTIRMDWKEKEPDQYALYFSCTSQLVPSFRIRFGDDLKLVGNRAMVFQLGAPLPEAILRSCLSVALRYQQVKNLPLLGL